jgi:hypothetical protein
VACKYPVDETGIDLTLRNIVEDRKKIKAEIEDKIFRAIIVSYIIFLYYTINDKIH